MTDLRLRVVDVTPTLTTLALFHTGKCTRPDLRLGHMSSPRSVKYRRLALVEPDQAKAQLLFQIADEADRGVLVTSERSYSRPVTISETSKDTKDDPPA